MLLSSSLSSSSTGSYVFAATSSESPVSSSQPSENVVEQQDRAKQAMDRQIQKLHQDFRSQQKAIRAAIMLSISLETDANKGKMLAEQEKLVVQQWNNIIKFGQDHRKVFQGLHSFPPISSLATSAVPVTQVKTRIDFSLSFERFRNLCLQLKNARLALACQAVSKELSQIFDVIAKQCIDQISVFDNVRSEQKNMTQTYLTVSDDNLSRKNIVLSCINILNIIQLDISLIKDEWLKSEVIELVSTRYNEVTEFVKELRKLKGLEKASAESKADT